jgi:hypothetical protein
LELFPLGCKFQISNHIRELTELGEIGSLNDDYQLCPPVKAKNAAEDLVPNSKIEQSSLFQGTGAESYENFLIFSLTQFHPILFGGLSEFIIGQHNVKYVAPLEK